jgi:hypothetical protein
LQEDARAPTHRGPVAIWIQAQDADLTAVGSRETFEELDGGGLAGPVGAEEPGASLSFAS